MLSIGGNDIGFSRLVANAVLSDSSLLRRLGGWFGQVHGFAEAGAQLDALEYRLKAVNRAAHYLLHVPWPESDRVILTGYPPMALLEDGSSVCPDGQPGMNVLPDFFLSEEKAREGNAAAERLHALMQDAAKQHRWTLGGGASGRVSWSRACASATRTRRGPWRTRCGCRARSMACGSPTTRRSGAPTPRASAGFARPTMPS